MKVPLLDLTIQNASLKDSLSKAFQRVLDSNHYILGPEVAALEEEMLSWTGSRHALGVASGTDALTVALSALGVGPGDEVICPAFTFFATASSVARLGARPVFADICPVCFNLTAGEVQKYLSPATRAVIPVHLFGQAADMDGIMKVVATHNAKAERDVAVIEDAAQAVGSQYRGRSVGSMGAFGTFSFFPSKNLGGFGEGGLVTTNDPELYERASMLRSHGSRVRYRHDLLGGNYRMDAIQAALLRVKLKKLGDYNSGRRSNAAFYQNRLKEIPGVVLAQESWCSCQSESAWESYVEDVRCVLPIEYTHNRSIWNQFTLRVRGEGQRDALKKFLSEKGIGSEVYYPELLFEQPCLDRPLDADSAFPHATRLTQECLSLPIYPELSADQLEFVSEAITEFFQ